MTQRYRFSYADIHHTLGLAAQEVIESGLEFDYILAIGGGGFIPARILRTYLNRPILSVALARYQDQGPALDEPIKLQWTEGFAEAVKGKRLLVVDEVDDQRTTLAWTLAELAKENPAAMSVLVLTTQTNRLTPNTRALWIEFLWFSGSKTCGWSIPGTPLISTLTKSRRAV